MKHTHVTFMESIMRRLDRVVFVRHNTLPSALFDHLWYDTGRWKIFTTLVTSTLCTYISLARILQWEFITVRVCNSNMVSTPPIWTVEHRQSVNVGFAIASYVHKCCQSGFVCHQIFLQENLVIGRMKFLAHLYLLASANWAIPFINHTPP